MLLFCLGTFVPAAAEVREASLPEVLLVGGDRAYPPYEFLDGNGRPSGYNVELTQAITEGMGLQIEFRLRGWSEMRAALQSGAVDLLQGMSFSEERLAEVDFSLPSTIINHAVYALLPVIADVALKTVPLGLALGLPVVVLKYDSNRI